LRAVILAGGRGTRLHPFTAAVPKPLLPLGDRPILAILIDQLRRHGVKHVTLAAGHRADQLEKRFGDGAKLGVQIDYAVESSPLGTIGPLGSLSLGREDFLVANGDVLTDLDFARLADLHRRKGAAATVAVHRREWRSELGVVELGPGDEVQRYVEKPVRPYHVSMGIYVFAPRALRFVARGRAMDLPELVAELIDSGERVAAFPFDGYWRDLGGPADYRDARRDFARMRARFLGDDDA
jgi:NDP-sugar pyrophosphorylase family protein